jgi:small subunit ribosomal protein S16
MAIKIRLAKTGKRNAPTYKIVVTNQKDKRNGKFLDILGSFNPGTQPFTFTYEEAKLNEWKAKGALLTSSVEELIAGTYEFNKYAPKAK